MYIYSSLPANSLINDSDMDIEGGSFEKSQKANKNSSQSGTNMNTNEKTIKRKHRDSEHSKVEGKNINLKGHSLKRKHRDSEHSKVEGKNINLKGHSLKRKHRDSEHSKVEGKNINLEGHSLKRKHKYNEQSKFETANKKFKESLSLTRNHKHGKFNEPNMNLIGNSLESKYEENEHRTVDETNLHLKGDGNKRKRKHVKHDKCKKRVKKSKREHVKSGNLISSGGEDILKRKSSHQSNSQGASSASCAIHEPGRQNCHQASLYENESMKMVNPMNMACSEGKCVHDVHTKNRSGSLSGMKQESCQKPRDSEYLFENPEEKLFFTILHRYATTDGIDYAKTRQELNDNNVMHLRQRGRWRQSEVVQLNLNMEYFRETHPSCDPGIFLYSYKYPKKGEGQERLEYRKLRQRFLRCLGYKIKRNLSNVYIKAIGCFFQGKTGKYSSAELELIRKHGDMKTSRRFVKLASKLDRHYLNIRWAYKDMGNEQTQKGPWTSKEDKILLQAIKTAQVQLGGDSVMGLPWTEISKTVQTRPPGICRNRYIMTLRWREEHQSKFRPPVSTADKIRLIEMVCESNVQEEVEIDWHSLLTDFPGLSSHTPLQKLWHRLKIKVPDYSCKNLDEITDHLAKFEIPKLQRKLEKQLQSVKDDKKVPVLKMEDNDV